MRRGGRGGGDFFVEDAGGEIGRGPAFAETHNTAHEPSALFVLSAAHGVEDGRVFGENFIHPIPNGTGVDDLGPAFALYDLFRNHIIGKNSLEDFFGDFSADDFLLDKSQEFGKAFGCKGALLK